MNLIISPFITIQENLALEQYFMQEEGDFLILSISKDCIVVGRNQVVYSEINIKEQQTNNIPVFRRNSGGGTVYLDSGTLNYAFIVDYNYLKTSYSYFNNIIIEILRNSGFEKVYENGCNIYCNGFKVSGTAQYKRKNRLIHHGTLLINTNLKLLKSVLNKSDKYKTNGKRSIPAETENLCSFKRDFALDDIINYAKLFYKEKKIGEISCPKGELLGYISEKILEFENKSWTYGNSPYYEFVNKVFIPGSDCVNVKLYVKNGIVIEQYISSKSILSHIDLVGKYHVFEDFLPLILKSFSTKFPLTHVYNTSYQFFNSEERN